MRGMHKDPSPYRIEVNAETSYVEEQSSPEESRYVFAYTITIRNTGSVPAKLLLRHWYITNADGDVQEVVGDGVVGEQPHLHPGEGFRYTSAAMIATPVGTMHGRYRMLADDGVRFDAEIQAFRLSLPLVFH